MNMNPFMLATDDTNRRQFREKLKALCDAAKADRIRLDVIADELLAQAVFMEVTSYDGKRWLERALGTLSRWLDFNDGVFTDELKKRIRDNSSVHSDK